jgi:hypothetical protein
VIIQWQDGDYGAGDDVLYGNKVVVVQVAVKNQMHSVEAWSLTGIYNESAV